MKDDKAAKASNSDKLLVVCSVCGTSTRLKGLSAWSFIILRTFHCEKCQKIVKEGEANER